MYPSTRGRQVGSYPIYPKSTWFIEHVLNFKQAPVLKHASWPSAPHYLGWTLGKKILDILADVVCLGLPATCTILRLVLCILNLTSNYFLPHFKNAPRDWYNQCLIGFACKHVQQCVILIRTNVGITTCSRLKSSSTVVTILMHVGFNTAVELENVENCLLVLVPALLLSFLFFPLLFSSCCPCHMLGLLSLLWPHLRLLLLLLVLGLLLLLGCVIFLPFLLVLFLVFLSVSSFSCVSCFSFFPFVSSFSSSSFFSVSFCSSFSSVFSVPVSLCSSLSSFFFCFFCFFVFFFFFLCFFLFFFSFFFFFLPFSSLSSISSFSFFCCFFCFCFSFSSSSSSSSSFSFYSFCFFLLFLMLLLFLLSLLYHLGFMFSSLLCFSLVVVAFVVLRVVFGRCHLLCTLKVAPVA